MAKTLIRLGRTATGIVIGDLTWDFCKKVSDNLDVSTTNSTLAECGVGVYILTNPNITEDTVFSLHKTADSAIYAEGAFSLADGDIALNSTVAKDTDIQTVLSRLTAARSGYLDKLNISGFVAASSEVTAIQNNTRVRVIVPVIMERPDSGSTNFLLHLYMYDEVGNMEAPDSAPTIVAANQAGTNRSGNLGSVTLVGTGHYSVTYTLAHDAAIEQILFEWSMVESGITRLHGAAAQVVDTTAVDFTSDDRSKLQAIHEKLPTGNISDFDETVNAVDLIEDLKEDGLVKSKAMDKSDEVGLSPQEISDLYDEIWGIFEDWGVSNSGDISALQYSVQTALGNFSVYTPVEVKAENAFTILFKADMTGINGVYIVSNGTVKALTPSDYSLSTEVVNSVTWRKLSVTNAGILTPSMIGSDARIIIDCNQPD